MKHRLRNHLHINSLLLRSSKCDLASWFCFFFSASWIRFPGRVPPTGRFAVWFVDPPAGSSHRRRSGELRPGHWAPDQARRAGRGATNRGMPARTGERGTARRTVARWVLDGGGNKHQPPLPIWLGRSHLVESRKAFDVRSGSLMATSLQPHRFAF